MTSRAHFYVTETFPDCKQYSNSVYINQIYRGGSRTATTSKLELFVIIVNGFQLQDGTLCGNS